MTTIGLILIWLAVLVLGAAVIDQRKAFTKLEEIEMRSISSLTTIKQDMDTPYVRKKTVMKITGITEQDIYEKMRMLEHPHNR